MISGFFGFLWFRKREQVGSRKDFFIPGMFHLLESLMEGLCSLWGNKALCFGFVSTAGTTHLALSLNEKVSFLAAIGIDL